MAEVTIRFRFNPATGKRELVIGYESESHMLSHEHEREHRALAEKLLGHPLGDGTVVRVERTQKGTVATEPDPAPEAPRRPEGTKNLR